MATKNIILGGGPAGIYAMETIRDLDADAEITLISDEPAYARMALPYYLSQEVPESQMLTADEAYYQGKKVTFVSGRASGLDAAAKTLTLEDGSAHSYDNLLLATGSRAQRLDIPGSNLPGVTTLWTLEDARQVTSTLPPNAEVCFIGAGFIGFIILNAMKKLGVGLHVVEVADHVLPRMLDADGAELVEDHLRGQGLHLHCGVTAQSISESGGKKTVSLSNGETITADLVVLATGIHANIELAQAAGIECDEGILVGYRCQTSAASVYAAGDCAQGPELITGAQQVHAIQPTAVDHGRIAGANMAGQSIEYAGSLLMNVLDVCGLQCASFGQWGGGEGLDETVILNPSGHILRKIIWQGDVMVGALIVGPMEDVLMLNDVGMFKGFIQTQTALGDWKAYVQQYPADIRRPYLATGVPAQLVERTQLGAPADSRGYRFRNEQPVTSRTEHHAVLVGTKSAN